jgi:hypothetical protein
MPCFPALLLLLLLSRLQVSRRCMAKVMEERAEICLIGTQQQPDTPCFPRSAAAAVASAGVAPLHGQGDGGAHRHLLNWHTTAA